MRQPRRLTLALILAAVCTAAAAGPAKGATYTVESCSNGSLSGWSAFQHGLFSGWVGSCTGAGGSMGAWISTAATSTAGWTFTAPADTDIAAFRVTRGYALSAGRTYGTGVYRLQTTGAGDGYYNAHPNYGAALVQGAVTQTAAGLSGQRAMTVWVECGGGGECTGGNSLNIYGASIDLRDDFAPAFGSVSGSLLGSGALKGTRAISYAAGDRGSGIAREQLVVDGVVRSDRPLSCSSTLVCRAR